MKTSKSGLLKNFLTKRELKKHNQKKETYDIITPKKYKKGLVLSGGGARGIAHLGAAKALYEAGHTFDVIIGTSMGAIVGCLLADGHQPDEMIKLLTPNHLLSFIRPDLSLNGMMTMNGAGKTLDKILSVKNLEELPIPFIAVATDLVHGKPHYFEKGNIIEAVIASASIPVIFPPIVIDGIQYIDGGVLNNLPVRYIKDDCEKIAGFHVNPQTLGIQDGEVKGLANIADRAFHLCMLSNILPDIKLCDFYLEHTNLNEYSTFDFIKAEEIFELGYVNTKNSLLTNNHQLII